MIEGKCPKCGASYFGWALRVPRNQSCSRCGTALKIYEDGKIVAEGYSPFTAEEYFLDLPTKDKPKTGATDKTKGKRHSS